MTTAPTHSDPYKAFNFTVQSDRSEAETVNDAFFVKCDAETTTASGDVAPAEQVTLNYTEVKSSDAGLAGDEFVFVAHPDATDPTCDIMADPEAERPPQDPVPGDPGTPDAETWISVPIDDIC